VCLVELLDGVAEDPQIFPQDRLAETSLSRALELSAGNAGILIGAAWLQGMLGHIEEAIQLCRRAIVLDPLNVTGHRYLGLLNLYADRLGQAETALQEAVELAPLSGGTHFGLGRVFLAQGRLAEALEEIQKESHEGFRLLGLSSTYHALGRTAESTAALEALQQFPVHSYLIAQAEAYRGHVDQAFEFLERACAQRNAGLVNCRMESFLRNLHADPRWRPLLSKVGLA
jgi:tetratricopeptide (TPR) repeat protein